MSFASDRVAALSPLLADEVQSDNLVFPHSALSLTHSGTVFVAARAEGCAGVGVDFECWRSVDVRTARFFLSAAERSTLDGEADLLRRWTVKEALFKATPDNAEAVLVDYDLGGPPARSGRVVGARGESFRYSCVDLESGHLAVAVCERGVDGDL